MIILDLSKKKVSYENLRSIVGNHISYNKRDRLGQWKGQVSLLPEMYDQIISHPFSLQLEVIFLFPLYDMTVLIKLTQVPISTKKCSCIVGISNFSTL
jgi:hypothetical protein